MDLIGMREIAFEKLGDKSSHAWKEKGNKYYHGQRVANLVLELRKRIFPEDISHDDILTAAAWFHDIKNGEENHAQKGAEKTRELLKNLCAEEELDEICDIIAVHDDRHPEGSPYSIYVQLQQDADHLDHFGTYDIWMIALYTVERGETTDDAATWFHQAEPSYNKCRSELNFRISKMIFDEKMEFEREFMERFSVECGCGVWKLPEGSEKWREDKKAAGVKPAAFKAI